jgi:hypothetical protein
MLRFSDCFQYPHDFDRAMRQFAASSAGAFSFVTAASDLGSELRWTWFQRQAQFTGHILDCVVLADDWSAESCL